MKIYNYKGNANLIGKQIQKLRKEKHISQEELAARLQTNNIELSQKAISRIEKQERFVSDYELFVLAKILDVNIYDLFDPEILR